MSFSLFSGLSKRAVKVSCQQERVSMVQLYKNVSYERESHGGVNHGFRVRANQVVTYQQERRALGYFYCKRKVLAIEALKQWTQKSKRGEGTPFVACYLDVGHGAQVKKSVF